VRAELKQQHDRSQPELLLGLVIDHGVYQTIGRQFLVVDLIGGGGRIWKSKRADVRSHRKPPPAHYWHHHFGGPSGHRSVASLALSHMRQPHTLQWSSAGPELGTACADPQAAAMFDLVDVHRIAAADPR
jgi:hypothetical protein